MSETPLSPLSAAQALVKELHESSDPAIKAKLAEVSKLLEQVSPPIPAPAPTDSEALHKQLDDLKRETADLISVMVHELRKPMTSIRGYLDMLAKPGMVGTLNDMQTQFLTTVRNNSLRLEGLVSDISDLNKLRNGRFRLDNKMTTFSQIKIDVEKKVEAMVTEYGQTITWETPAGMPVLMVDVPQFSKVLHYLLKNAIQYTPKGTGQITFKSERLDGNILHITITDNGIGMKPEEITRLGEPFYRGDHEIVTNEKGFGLGIPIVIEMIKYMGGSFDPVISEPGKGTTFGVKLPGMG